MDWGLAWPAALTLLLGVGAISDIRARRLPNWLALALLALGLSYGFASGGLSGLGWHAAHAGIALLIGMPLFAIGAFGGGDVKTYAGLAGYFALDQGLTLLVWVALFGGLFVLAWLAYRMVLRAGRKIKSGDYAQFPYGVAIAAGGAGLAWSNALATI